MVSQDSWTSNKGAANQVGRLLEDSGILFESSMASVCRKFADANNKSFGTRVRTESITYGLDTEQSPLRELDQCVHFYKEFHLDQKTGIALNVSIPIEAKYRRDIEAFGIKLSPDSYVPRVPLVSSLYGSRLADTLLRPKQPFSDVPLTRLVFLEIQDGRTPKKVHKENLIFNIAAKLYEFTKFDFAGEGTSRVGNEFIVRHRLVKRFENYLNEKHYAWWQVLREWMDENLTETMCAAFNKSYFGNGRIFFGVKAHLPVLCLNMPLHEIIQSERGSPSFKPCECMVLRVRVPSWPGHLRTRLIRYTVEPPLLVTNLTGLHSLLDAVFTWFRQLGDSLRDSKPEEKKRWAVEASFFQAVVDKYAEAEKEDFQELRSDLDIFELM